MKVLGTTPTRYVGDGAGNQGVGGHGRRVVAPVAVGRAATLWLGRRHVWRWREEEVPGVGMGEVEWGRVVVTHRGHEVGDGLLEGGEASEGHEEGISQAVHSTSVPSATSQTFRFDCNDTFKKEGFSIISSRVMRSTQ